MAISHADCTHPRTPAGRRACRDSGISAADRRGLARTAGRDAQIAAKLRARPERIQPRRSGARVAIDSSGCVQAALHTGRGKCACGWENWDAA